MPVDNSDYLDPGDLFDAENPCNGQCDSQCDNCHDLDNCVPGDCMYGDLLLCKDCRSKYPSHQPWRIDPETGDYIDCDCVQHRTIAQQLDAAQSGEEFGNVILGLFKTLEKQMDNE